MRPAPAPEDDGIAQLILRSFGQRRALWNLVLATYRVELTEMLSRMAREGLARGDADEVESIADRIAEAGRAAQIPVVRREAMRLRERAAGAREGGKREEGEMLKAGLRVIDRILDSTPPSRAASAGKEALN